jgi:hypothetical protein
MNKVQKDQELQKIRDEIWKLSISPFYKYRKENNYYPVIGEVLIMLKFCLSVKPPQK